jgi:hypothetical protein
VIQLIKPDELYEYMKSQLTHDQLEDKQITELLPVIVKGIIIAVQSAK